MRRLNLLRQLLYSETICDICGCSPSTRLLTFTLNTLNSRRHWQDVLVVSNRELLAAAGYQQSRYSRDIIKRFHEEGTAAGLFTVETARVTVYRLTELTRAHIEYVMGISSPLCAATSAPLSAAPSTALSAPHSAANKVIELRNNGVSGEGNNNGSNTENTSKSGSEGRRVSEDRTDSDEIVRELSELGL